MATTPTTTKNKAQETASAVGDKARETASNLADKGRETMANVSERAREMASSAGEAAANVGQRAEDAASAVGSGMESLAGTIREYAPQGSLFGSAGASIASGLESGGRYLQEEGLSGMGEDLTNLIRRNPLPAILIGIGFGYLLARATRR